jgi:hypothetical protein
MTDQLRDDLEASFILDVSDIPPDDQAGMDAPDGYYQADGCDNPVVRVSHKGPPPKFCPDHKGKTSTKTTTSTTKATGNGGWVKAPQIEAALNNYVKGAATLVSVVNKADGAIVGMNMPAVIHELVELGKTDKSIRKYLEWIATPGKYGPLVTASLGVIIPILANHNLMPVFHIDLSSRGE